MSGEKLNMESLKVKQVELEDVEKLLKIPAFQVIQESFKRYTGLFAKMMPSLWFVAMREGEPIGLIGGHKQGLIGIALKESTSIDVADALFNKLEKAQIDMGSQRITILIDAFKTKEISLLSRRGYTVHGFVKEGFDGRDQVSMSRGLQMTPPSRKLRTKIDMAEVTLNVLGEDDIDASADIAFQVFQEEFPQWTKETWIGMLSSYPVRFAAKSGAKIIGFVAGREGWLDAIVVTPEMQGKGIGELLIEKFEEYHQAKNISRIRIHVKANNTKAISLYSRKGYSIHGIVLTHEKYSIFMHKKLN